MKIAFTADWHIHPFKEFSRNVPVLFNQKTYKFIELPKDSDISPSQEMDFAIINSRLLDQYNALRHMADICKKENVEVLVIAGDIFHKRGNLPTETLYVAKKIITYFSQKLKIPVYILAGNHDQDSNSIKPLDNLVSLEGENIYISSIPEEIELNDNTILRMVPYRHNRSIVLSEFKKSVSKEVDTILVSHIGVSGASLGKQVYVSSDDFSIKDINSKKYKFVALGHFHKPQNLTKNTFYCGSPVQMNFGEEGESHGFYIGDTLEDTLVFYELPAPKFVTSTSTENAKEESLKGNYVRLKCIAQSVGNIEKTENIRIEVEKEFESKPVRLSLQMSYADMLKEYSKVKEKPDFLNTGLDILKTVIEGDNK